MDKEAKKFLIDEVPGILAGLGEHDAPLWGSLSAYNMVEHLIEVFDISMNSNKIHQIYTPVDKLEKALAFLLSEKKFPQNFENPVLEDRNVANEKKYQSLALAKEALVKIIKSFYAFFDQNTDFRSLHPVFGEIGFREWQIAHYKHVSHHFEQFGLMKQRFV